MDRKVRIFRAFASLVLVVGLASLSSCEKYVWCPPEVSEDVVISFTDHIFPVCNSCHGSWSSATVYDNLFDRVDTVTPASSSILSLHSTIFDTRMVQVNDTLSLKVSEVIKLWASQGAENN